MIRSLIEQDYEDWELIVIDDGSSDDTASVVGNLARKDSRIKLHALGRNLGPNHAKNAGALMAAGTWLVFMDSDDTFSPDALPTIHSMLNKLATSLLFCACIDSEGKPTSEHPEFDGYVDYGDFLCGKVKGEYLPIALRSAFLQVLFPETVRGGEGMTWGKLCKVSGPMYVSPKVCRYYNTLGNDRMSIGAKNARRLAAVHMLELCEFFLDYLTICPWRIAEKLLKVAYYRVVSLRS